MPDLWRYFPGWKVSVENFQFLCRKVLSTGEWKAESGEIPPGLESLLSGNYPLNYLEHARSFWQKRARKIAYKTHNCGHMCLRIKKK